MSVLEGSSKGEAGARAEHLLSIGGICASPSLGLSALLKQLELQGVSLESLPL